MASKPSPYLGQPSSTLNVEQSFAEVIRFFRRRWMLIFGVMAVVTLLGTLMVMQADRLYTAVGSVAVQAQKSQVVAVKDVVGELTPDEKTMATQAAILGSNRLIGRVVDDMKLDQDPEFNPAVRKPTFSLLKPSTWFGAKPVPKPRLTSKQQAERRTRIINAVTGAFVITPSEKSFVINIAATSLDSQKAQAMVNKLSDLYIQDGIETKFDASKRASDYLQSRVSELRGDALQSDRAAETYRAATGLAGPAENQTIDTQQLSEINSQLIIARSERAAKEAQLSQVRSLTAGDGSAIETSGLILGSSLIQRLREQESEVQRNLANLQATYGQNHPKIINANAELRDLRAKIMEEVRKVAASTANDVAVSRARENTLAGSLAAIEGRVNRGGEASVRLRELQREADANKSVYETFLNRLKETTQQVDVQSSDARIISTAMIPLSPSAPRVNFTIIASAATGFILGLLLALMLEKLDNTVRGADALEAMGGGATLAFLPVVSGDYERAEDIVIDRPQAMAAESLRTLRSALALSDVDNPPKVVMLSSSVPAEGKTFVSSGLARVSAQAVARTLLIDADMRHPRVHSAIGIDNGPGLDQVLSGQSSLADAIRSDPSSDLHILTAGTGSINPPDLLRSETMQRLLQQIRAEYDFIVIDTPPFVPMTDSQILTSLVDKMILVVRWGSTPVPVVQNVLKQIHRLDAPLVGSVMSRVSFARQANYGFGDYGYHYSRYGAYYGTQE